MIKINLDENSELCPICLSNIKIKTRIDSCPHIFCRCCIQKWYKIKKSCPCCRKIINNIIY